jgi:hypothetical protein
VLVKANHGLRAQMISLWIVGIIWELLAIWIIEHISRAPDLPWHD